MASSANNFCSAIFDYDAVRIIGKEKVGWLMVLVGCLYIFASLAPIVLNRYQKFRARRGNESSLKNVVFPVFVYVLYGNFFANIYVGIAAFAFDFSPNSHTNPPDSVFAFAVMYGVQHLVFEGVAFLLMQKGVGFRAAFKAFRYSGLWGLVTFFSFIVRYANNVAARLASNFLWNLILLFFYLILWIAPQKNLYRRPAVIIYARFWFFLRALIIFVTIIQNIPGLAGIFSCLFLFIALFPVAILASPVIYYTLLQDSRWWQGLDISQGRRDLAAEEIRSPLAGMDLPAESAQRLAASLDTFISIRGSSSPVRLLNFAYISLNKAKLLGTGSFSKVYQGKYKGRECAIKLIFTMDLTEDVIRRVAAEASLLSSIRNPNVVEILGVSVLPPSVCILLELCQYGSLTDLIGGTGFANLGKSATFISDFLKGAPIIGQSSKRGLRISWADRLYLAIGCARGLAALHNFNPYLCHRDVKSFNFLVDSKLNAKIADLELGANSERKSSNEAAVGILRSSLTIGPVRPGSLEANELGIGETVLSGDEILANWSAPEVIRNGSHFQPSDIYSLGLVFWELLSGKVPFSEIKKQDDIRFNVLSGKRPEIYEQFLEGNYNRQFEPFLNLIMKMWCQEARDRPNINQVITAVMKIYNDRCHSILSTTKALTSTVEMLAMQVQTRKSFWNFSNSIDLFKGVSVEDVAGILKGLRSEGVLDEFTVREEAWVLILPPPSCVVIWGTMVWEQSLNISMQNAMGAPLKTLPFFERKPSSSVEWIESIESFFRQLSDVERGVQPIHHILGLPVPLSSSTNSLSNEELGLPPPPIYKSKAFRTISEVASEHVPFSIHAFPVRFKTDTADVPLAKQNTGISSYFRPSMSRSWRKSAEPSANLDVPISGVQEEGKLSEPMMGAKNDFKGMAAAEEGQVDEEMAGGVEPLAQAITEKTENEEAATGGGEATANNSSAGTSNSSSRLRRNPQQLAMIALQFTKLQAPKFDRVRSSTPLSNSSSNHSVQNIIDIISSTVTGTARQNSRSNQSHQSIVDAMAQQRQLSS